MRAPEGQGAAARRRRASFEDLRQDPKLGRFFRGWFFSLILLFVLTRNVF